MTSPIDFSDTIVAPATASGRGALSIVRLSGPNAHGIVRGAVDRWPSDARVAVLTSVRDERGDTLDQSVVIRYDGPASFTGEDAVEIMTHGGFVVPTTIVAAMIARGARLAAPGEFTRRALLNGKLDILQAEATGDLVNANSRAAQGVALRQLDGGLSRRVLALRDELIGLEALIAYDIDFPEEDDGPIAGERIIGAADSIVAALEQLLATARTGELVREGALVVLAGLPNVGKSSLFNALLGARRAIVTDIAGTTRDAIEAVIDTPTVPLRLVDTAGLRDAIDPVEKIGVEVSESYAARAAVVLACGDSVESLDEVTRILAAKTSAPIIQVRTKADLAGDLGSMHSKFVAVSAETGVGLRELTERIAEVVGADADLAAADASPSVVTPHSFATAC